MNVLGTWFTQPSGITKTCETIDNPIVTDDELEFILMEEWDYNVYNDEMIWMKKYYIFLQLLDDPSLLANTVLDSFASVEEANALGKLATIWSKRLQVFHDWVDEEELRRYIIDSMLMEMQYIDSLLSHDPSDSLDLYMDRDNFAGMLLDSFTDWQTDLTASLSYKATILDQLLDDLGYITPTNDMEENLKLTLELTLTNELGDRPSSGDRVDLLKIASQCVWQGGPGVYLAQVLYSSLEDTTFSHNPLPCIELSSRSDQSEELTEYAVLPNPSSGHFKIMSLAGDVRNSKYFVSDIVGNVIVYGVLYRGVDVIDLSAFPEGQYFVHITENETHATNTISLIKLNSK